jgi:N-acetylglucosaminyl-diphospho-decaprenol L-rhamnosyltransferase
MELSMGKVAAIVVSHNSEKFIQECVGSLVRQTHPLSQIIIVDSGSKDISYLAPYQEKVIYAKAGTGFSEANNIGWKALQNEIAFVLFLNPDAFLTPHFVENALAIFKNNPKCGALTSPLHRYDFLAKCPTGHYDSTGIFTTWYGHWYDRGQGEKINGQYSIMQEVPALCGALIFGRREAFDSVLLRGEEVWNETFFMYKEDIDLSLRLKKKGWKLLFVPALLAYHGRGWSSRKNMSRKLRLCSARNELRINADRPWALPYSLAKYLAVKLFDI